MTVCIKFLFSDLTDSTKQLDMLQSLLIYYSARAFIDRAEITWDRNKVFRYDDTVTLCIV